MYTIFSILLLSPPLLSPTFFYHLLFSMSSQFHNPLTLSPPTPSSSAPIPSLLLCLFRSDLPSRGRARRSFRARASSSSTTIPMWPRHCYNRHFFHLCTILILSQGVVCLAGTESDALVRFKRSLEDSQKLASWDASKGEPCASEKESWIGVICLNGHVWGLDLEDMGLGGVVNVSSLKELKYLRIFSLMRNNFGSAIPDFKQLSGLKVLFLSNNSFAGEIPDDAFEDMTYLKKVHMANNKFNGTIPKSLAGLPKLVELRLEGNRFEGKIPNFQIKEHLRTLNVSNNALEGPIPKSLAKMNASAFEGNKALCGWPLDPCDVNPVTTPAIRKKPSILSIVVLEIVVLAALVAIGAVIYILQQRKRTPASVEDPPAHTSDDREVDSGSPSGSNQSARKAEGQKLTFLRDDRESFDLQELLKASAEILGCGSFGSSYKAGLATGPVMVVKRFKQLNNVGKREFKEHMRRLGRLDHPNLLPTVAYFYKKEEKLLITDYVQMGSLAVCLHGHQTVEQASLDWATRLKIVKGIAKGLQCLYAELPSLVTPHGHLKSSNVLLTASFHPLLTDYGLIPVVNQESAQDLMVAYKSPEYARHGRVTKKTDVWAFGLLVLEILTGRFPANCLHKGKTETDMDLVTWVRSVFSGGELAGEVIDREMAVTRGGEAEVAKLLRVALECCEEVERRPDMREVAERVQQVKEGGADEDFFTSYGGSDKGDEIKSVRGLSDDFNYV